MKTVHQQISSYMQTHKPIECQKAICCLSCSLFCAVNDVFKCNENTCTLTHTQHHQPKAFYPCRLKICYAFIFNTIYIYTRCRALISLSVCVCGVCLFFYSLSSARLSSVMLPPFLSYCLRPFQADAIEVFLSPNVATGAIWLVRLVNDELGFFLLLKK